MLLLAACVPEGEPALTPEPNMPEPGSAITQATEVGPVSEGYFDRANLEAAFLELEPGVRSSGFAFLAGPASRVSVLAVLDDADAVDLQMQVQPGWSSGQTGPWVSLERVWAEAGHRVWAADLETAATRLRFRVLAGGLGSTESLRWAANIPLAPMHRSQSLEPVDPGLESIIVGGSSYGASSAVCAVPGQQISKVVLHRIPSASSADSDLYLRSLQALDLHGLQWCDLRANYVLGVGAPRSGRGDRQGAVAGAEVSNQGVVAVAVAGCESPNGSAESDLGAVLTELTGRYGLSVDTEFSVSGAGACPEADSPWLQTILDGWLQDAPFVPVTPPPISTGSIRGQVMDVLTEDALADVQVQGSWGATVLTLVGGTFVFEPVPEGDHTLSLTKVGWKPVSIDVSVRAEMSTSVEVRLEADAPPVGVSVIDHTFLIEYFGGRAADPMLFAETPDGFQSYLDAVGVTYFSATEYITPNNPRVAEGCGYSVLLPERSVWPRAGALGLLADQLRALVNEPVVLRNWWRPPCYNAGVGGAAGGDHPDADALDLDFRSARSRADAQRHLCNTYWLADIVAPEDIEPGSNLNPRLNMSLGLGGATLHLGLLSRNGRRYWKYASYSQVSDSGTCW